MPFISSANSISSVHSTTNTPPLNSIVSTTDTAPTEINLEMENAPSPTIPRHSFIYPASENFVELASPGKTTKLIAAIVLGVVGISSIALACANFSKQNANTSRANENINMLLLIVGFVITPMSCTALHDMLRTKKSDASDEVLPPYTLHHTTELIESNTRAHRNRAPTPSPEYTEAPQDVVIPLDAPPNYEPPTSVSDGRAGEEIEEPIFEERPNTINFLPLQAA